MPALQRDTVTSPEPACWGPTLNPCHPLKNGFSHGLLWKCRVVLRQSRELAQQVLDGKIALHAAFNEASPPTPRSTRERRPLRPERPAPKETTTAPKCQAVSVATPSCARGAAQRERGNPGGTVNSKGVHIADKPKEIEIVSDGRDMFAVVDGVRIAKRGRPGTPEAGTWVTLVAGWTVTGGGPEDDEILITHDGGRVH
jgi:hypothetical protein